MRRKFAFSLILWLGFLSPVLATSQLIVNGSFSGPNVSPPWMLQGAGVQPGSANGLTYLEMADANNQTQKAYQTVAFSSNLIAATLTFDYQIVSSDPNQDDYLTVAITDTNSNFLIDLFTFSSADTTSDLIGVSTNFISHTVANTLSAYAGQKVNVEFYVTTDANYGYLTQFYLTGVSLVEATTADIPANDDFTNAIVVPARGITNTVTTTYASREPGEPEIVGNPGGHSLWWTWTATSLGTVTVNAPGSSFTYLLGVYTGSSVDALTVVTNGANRPLTFGVTPGTRYYIALDGVNGASGSAEFVLRFSNDLTPPTVAILSPKAGANVTSSSVAVAGTALDNVAVASVFYRLENADGTSPWQLAAGTSSWSGLVTNLFPGTNIIQAEAYDTSTNVSKIMSRAFNYAVPIPLALAQVGEGKVSGATNMQLLDLNDPYQLTATAAAGFAFKGWTGSLVSNSATVKFVMASNFNLTATFADVSKPVLSITAPTAKERLSNDMITLSGKAKDNVGVTGVWFQLNTGAWTPVHNTTNAWTNWTAAVAPSPGANTIRAYAADAAGNFSPTNSVSFIYVLSAPLTVQTNGLGKVSPNYNNALLAIGTNYSMTATASKGYVFSNWTSSIGEFITNGSVLKFVMASNLNFIANFVLNPFTTVAGTYGGLFYNTNSGEVTPESSGSVTATVKSDGSFSAKFQQGGKSYSISGQFSLTGGWSTSSLKTWNNTAISLQLDLTGGNTMTGSLSNATWNSELSANRDVFSTADPSPQKGTYTLILPGTNSNAGNGFGTVTVVAGGTVTLGGMLGDGTKVMQSSIESDQGEWPVYISLENGAGMLLGWLEFTNEPGQNIVGPLNWFKPGSSTNQIEVIGSRYSLLQGEPVLNLTNGYVLMEGGGLMESIRDTFSLGANNVVKGSNKLALKITTANGLFQGTATNAAGKTITINGAILQNQTDGFGQFLNAGQIGSVILAPQPQ